MTSAVTAASSATGRSDVPAHTTSTVPVPAAISPRLRDDGPRVLVIHRVGHDRAHGVVGLGRGPGHEQAVPAGGDAGGDGGNLRRGLADAEDDFRESLAQVAVRVDAGKAQIVERRRAHGVAHAARGVGRAGCGRREPLQAARAAPVSVIRAKSEAGERLPYNYVVVFIVRLGRE